jgi:hypothetical protein
VYDKNSSNSSLYVGTDVGVYYRNSSNSSWTSYSTGLPNVVVNELEIQYTAQKLRAATYGRGVWETNLFGASGVGINQASEIENEINIIPNPNDGHFLVSFSAFLKSDYSISVYNSLGQVLFAEKLNNFQGLYSKELNVEEYGKGFYFVSVTNGNNETTTRKIIVN